MGATGALTDKTLKSLKRKPADAGTTYDEPDGIVPGLFARVSPKGRVTFILYTRYPGSPNPSRRAVGVYDGANLQKVREKARHWLDLISRGIDPAEEERALKIAAERKRANSFRNVCEDFFAEKLKGERRGYEVERDIRKNFLGPWNGRPIVDIEPEDIAAIIKAKVRDGAPVQARNLLGFAKRLFQWAVDQHAYGLKVNPAVMLKPTALCGDKVVRERNLSDEEVFAFSRAAERMRYPYGPIYRLLLLTGLRLNEVVDAKWSEFDLAKGTWTIPASRMKGKNGKARDHVVPLTDDILKVINRLPRFATGEYLFSTNYGGKRKPCWISSEVKNKLDARMLRTLRAMAKKRGDDPRKVTLEHWQNHDLRRVVRSGLSKLKIVDEVAEAVLAHRRKGIQGVYDRHDYLAEKKEALQLWAGRLRDIVSPPPSNLVKLETARIS
jgi:integrase